MNTCERQPKPNEKFEQTHAYNNKDGVISFDWVKRKIFLELLRN